MDKSAGGDRMLVCGNVDGKFESLLARLEQLSIKFTGTTKFEQLFVCGEFFGRNADDNKKILNGSYIVNIPIYIIGPLHPDRTKYYTASAGENLGNNIIFLGRKGVFTTASGLKIAYLSGKEGEYADECHFSPESVNDLITQVTAATDFRGVDVLLTTQWSAGVEKMTVHTPDVASDDQLQGSSLISRLAAAMKPRYHFAAMAECHYERPPYRNHKVLQESSSLYAPTRFVGLARCGNPSRCKWLYAFNIAPMVNGRPFPTSEHPTCTEFPYGDVLQELEQREQEQRAAKAQKRAAQDQYFFDTNAHSMDDDDTSRRKRKKPPHSKGDGEPRQQQPCWFCLASPQVEKHLIVSVGEHAYLALAKGPLVEDHVLITPISHVQSLAACQNNAELREEISKFQQSLDKYLASTGRTAVYFERNFRTQHMQLQCIPIPSDRVDSAWNALEEGLALCGAEPAAIRQPDANLGDLLAPGTPYFYAEVRVHNAADDDSHCRRLYATKLNKSFSLNFARQVLASSQVLDLPDSHVDWRRCVLGQEQEMQAAATFRQRFSAFDFNNSDAD